MKTCHKKELRQAEKELREQNRGQKLVHREIGDTPSEVREMCNQGEQSRCDDLATICVCKSARAFTIVEDKYFRKYSRHLNRVRGRIRVPMAWKVRERVGVIAEDLRDALKKELGLECEFYSASSDIWTGRNKAAFICFTIHYVDREFWMHSWVLEVKSLPGKHDANAIAKAPQEFMTAWGLKREKCVKFLRDGASNGRKACDMLGLDSMACLAHCLHLIVGSGIVKTCADLSAEILMTAAKTSEEFEAAIEAQASEEVDAFIFSECANSRADLDELRAVVEQFRKLAVFFSRSPKAMEQLTLLQKHPLQTITDCATRWNSTHAMLVDLRPALDDFFEYVASSGEFSDSIADQPTAEQWFTIKCQPFARASNGLGGEKYPTLVIAVPVLWSVKRKLANEHIFDSILLSGGKEDYIPRVEALIQSVRETYVKLFSDRFINPIKTTSRFSKKSAKKSISRTVNKDEIPDELMWISILDPRSSELKYYSPAEAEQAREQLLNAAVEMAKQINAVSECSDENTDTSNSAQLTTPHKENVAWLTDVFGGGTEDFVDEPLSVDDEKIRERCKSQLLVYMSNAHHTPVTTSALQWWRDNQKGCSIIAALARNWLGCIATSVPSERAFSKSGNVVTTKRCSLAPDTIRDVLFVSENYEEEDSCGESDDDTGDEN